MCCSIARQALETWAEFSTLKVAATKAHKMKTELPIIIFKEFFLQKNSECRPLLCSLVISALWRTPHDTKDKIVFWKNSEYLFTIAISFSSQYGAKFKQQQVV
jgi:hypothetical protein